MNHNQPPSVPPLPEDPFGAGGQPGAVENPFAGAPFAPDIPVVPPVTETPKPRVGRRVVLGFIAAGAVVAATSSILRHKNPGSTSPVEIQAPTEEPEPTEAVTPDEGAPLEYQRTAENLSTLDDNARTDTDGCTEYLAINPSEADSWHAGALRYRLDQGFTKNTTVLEFGDNIIPNDPNAGTLDSYFKTLYDAGITADAWGRVAVAPDFTMHGGDARHYATAVNRTVRALHRYAPGAKASVLVNVATDDSQKIIAALQAGEGKTLETSKLESVGVEGFSNDRIPFDAEDNADVSAFLNVDRIVAAAKAFGKDKVWISTGIPATDRTLMDRGQDPGYTTTQREKIAEAMANVVEQLMQRGLTVVGFSLLAQNKLTAEGRDFSFPPGEESPYRLLHDRLAQLDPTNLPLTTYAAPPTR